MAGALRDHHGGIAGLCRLIELHGKAFEYDLLTLGLRLRWLGDGTGRLRWTDLRAIVDEGPATSAIRRSMGTKGWDLNEYLLAAVVDAVREGNWQRQGKATAKRPERIKTPASTDTAEVRTIGADPIPIHQFHTWWNDQGGE